MLIPYRTERSRFLSCSRPSANLLRRKERVNLTFKQSIKDRRTDESEKIQKWVTRSGKASTSARFTRRKTNRLPWPPKYLADGLRAGERVLNVAESDAALNRFRAALNRQRINVPVMVKRGALVESTHAEAHLADGRFDSERMLRFLNEAMETALTDGFSGLRTCGDMSWLLKDPVGADQVVEYRSSPESVFSWRSRCGHVPVPTCGVYLPH